MRKTQTILPLALCGSILILTRLLTYFLGIAVSIFRWLALVDHAVSPTSGLVWYSGLAMTLGVFLAALDSIILLPEKRLRAIPSKRGNTMSARIPPMSSQKTLKKIVPKISDLLGAFGET